MHVGENLFPLYFDIQILEFNKLRSLLAFEFPHMRMLQGEKSSWRASCKMLVSYQMCCGRKCKCVATLYASGIYCFHIVFFWPSCINTMYRDAPRFSICFPRELNVPCYSALCSIFQYFLALLLSAHWFPIYTHFQKLVIFIPCGLLVLYATCGVITKSPGLRKNRRRSDSLSSSGMEKSKSK